MKGESLAGSKLVASMLVGAQPIGLRGDPLHTLQGQIRAVVRRRLGERHFHLLAEPLAYEASSRVDWYSALDGETRLLALLTEPERGDKRAEIDALLLDIDRLGQSLQSGATEDARLAGAFLRLAARPPRDDCCYLVGDQPVVIGWGYEVEAVTDAGAPSIAALPPPLPVLPPPVVIPPPVAPVVVTPPAAFAVSGFPWVASLVIGFAAIVSVLLAAWALRQVVPQPPAPQVTMLPAPPPPPPVVVFDPTPDLLRDMKTAQDEQGRLNATLASLRGDLATKRGQCKPPDLPEDGWKKRDLAVLEGCWILGHETSARLKRTGLPDVLGVTTAARLCFARAGRGTFEISNRFAGATDQCQGQVSAAYVSEGVVRITHANLPCVRDGVSAGHWMADTLTCRRVDDTRAICRHGNGVESEFRRAGAAR